MAGIELLWIAFLIKHFVADFPLQTSYHYLNKGKFGHLGGIEHALIHAIGTVFILLSYALFVATIPLYLIFIAVADGVSHYFIDWGKVNLTNKCGWSTMTDKGLLITSNHFFIALGLDQLLHYLTYAILIGMIV